MRRYQFNRLSPERLKRHRDYASNYARLRANPQKACVKCETIFPNTPDFFAIGAGGNVTGHCRLCWDMRKKSKDAIHGPCPVCETPARLVNDRGAPRLANGLPPRLCMACVIYSKRIEGKRLEEHLDRFCSYARWRQAK